eukprot:15069919-Ditylum_brightwellii.AAC.1
MGRTVFCHVSCLMKKQCKLANSCTNEAHLHKDGLIIKNPIFVHSGAHVALWNTAKRKGQHT